MRQLLQLCQLALDALHAELAPGPARKSVPRSILVLEDLENRTLLSTSGTPPPDDVPEGIVRVIDLDASGSGTQIGEIDYSGDVDSYSITIPVTGRTYVRVDSGILPEQEVEVPVLAGQSFIINIFADDDSTGSYTITITTIQDDFPDSTTRVVPLDASGSGSQTGVINYSDDVDHFRFTATKSGIMTLRMATTNYSGLDSRVAVSGVANTNEFLIGRLPGIDRTLNLLRTNDQVIQFAVVAGRTYFVEASGANDSSGAYTLEFAMAVDKVSDTVPQEIPLDISGSGSQEGAIETQGDIDLFQFTATVTGYMLVMLDPAVASNLRGLLTFLDSTYFNASFGQGFRHAATGQIVVLQVTDGETYQFQVSGIAGALGILPLLVTQEYGVTSTPPPQLEPGSIGGYKLTFTTLTPGDDLDIRRGSSYDLGINAGLIVQIDYQYQIPEITHQAGAVAPVLPPTPGTATRLSVVPVPTPSAAPSSSGPATPTLQLSSAPTSSGNVLVTTLLTVAARDAAAANSLPPALVSNSADSLTLLMTAANLELDGNFVAGRVFEDLNGDGVADGDEPGTEGETIVLERREGNRFRITRTLTTDGTGRYVFSELPPGQYRVRFVRKPTATPLSTPESYEINIRNDSMLLDLHFGESTAEDGAFEFLPGPVHPVAEDDESDKPQSSSAALACIGLVGSVGREIKTREQRRRTPLAAGV